MESGQEIVKRAFRVSGGALPDNFSVIINASIDFSGVSREQLIEWSLYRLTVDLQKLRDYASPEFIRTLARDGLNVHATECGSKVLDPQTRIDELAKVMPRQLAELYVRDRATYDSLLASVVPVAKKK